MPDVPLDLSRLLVDLKKFAEEYEALITLLAFVVPLSGVVIKVFLDRQKNSPNLYLELVDVGGAGAEENVTFGLRVTNLGERPAMHCRYIWTPRSTLMMTPLPAGFLVPKDEPKRFEFTMDSDELIGHGLAGFMRSHYRMLGWFELTYSASWWRWKKVGTAVIVGESPDMPVELGQVPRPPWTDHIIPLKKWKEKRIRDKDIRDLDRYLQRCRDFLAAHGIEVKLLFPKETFNRLALELQNRGWQWSYGPGGRGFEVYAHKDYPPSSGMTIRLSANTPVDTATLVVASAIESDEQH